MEYPRDRSVEFAGIDGVFAEREHTNELQHHSGTT